MSTSNQDKSINFQGSKPRFFNKKKDGDGSQYAFRSKKMDKNSDSSSSRQYGNADEKQIKSTGSHKSGLNVKAKPFSKAEFGRNSMGAPSSSFKRDDGDQCKYQIWFSFIHHTIFEIAPLICKFEAQEADVGLYDIILNTLIFDSHIDFNTSRS